MARKSPSPSRSGEDRVVLDTSVFTNPDVYRQFGDEPLEALRRFSALALETPLSFYMPVSVYRELSNMVDLSDVGKDVELALRIRSPRRYQLMIPADLLYELIDEIRKRIDKGLRIAEQAVTARHDTEEESVRRLRARYREALRQGIVDSREDMDVILLAYELDAEVATADEGIVTWADKLGIPIMNVRNLRATMEGLKSH